MKKLHLAVLALLAVVLVAGCSNDKPAFSEHNKKISVVTTFYPLYEFSSRVGGDRVDVYNLLPPGSEPHDWEPTPRELARVENADVFVYNGAGMEPWVQERLLPVLKNKGVKVVDASSGQDLIRSGPGYDPHFLLDPTMARHTVQQITAALVSIDPAGEEEYRARSESYSKELAALDREFSTAAKNFKSKDIVTSHSAFAYLARRYGLRQLSVLGLSPDEQPSPEQLKNVVNFVRANKVRTIFFEPLVSSRLPETVAREAGVKTGILNPVEGLTPAQISKGDNYITLMKQNLAALKEALAQ